MRGLSSNMVGWAFNLVDTGAAPHRPGGAADRKAIVIEPGPAIELSPRTSMSLSLVLPFERRRILLVDDDYLIALEAETALVDAEVEIVGVAVSAAEAVELATARRSALAVMDVRRSGSRDGIDAALPMFRELGIRCDLRNGA